MNKSYDMLKINIHVPVLTIDLSVYYINKVVITIVKRVFIVEKYKKYITSVFYNRFS
jgi:hypothetical protein